MSSKSPIDASHHDTLRKRVGKACDRCRLKKSKCDGMSPCSRCRIDNAICVFGERKKSHDKVYPKGYVEMLEQQQSQLVAGLQETYRRLVGANLWPGALLDEPEGHPLTHDILSVLDIIHVKPGSPSSHFEEDPVRLQQRLIAQGAPFIARRGSMSSDSEHSCHSHKRARSDVEETPMSSPVQKTFRRPSEREASSASPLQATSPFSFSLTLPNKARKASKPSPLSLKTEEMRVEVQPAEDESLMTPWQWQDFTSDGLAMEPQFTFPQEDASLVDSWGAMGSAHGQFDPTIMATYPAGLNFNFDPSRELLDLDMSNSIQVVS